MSTLIRESSWLFVLIVRRRHHPGISFSLIVFEYNYIKQIHRFVIR